MSLIASFIANHIIKELESVISSHSPEMKTEFIKELGILSNMVLDWVNSKLKSSLTTTEEK